MTDAPIVCVHPSSEVAVVSDSLAEMLYYKREQLVGNSFFDMVAPQDRQQALRCVCVCLVYVGGGGVSVCVHAWLGVCMVWL